MLNWYDKRNYTYRMYMDMFINLWAKVFHSENGQKTFFGPSINIFDPIISIFFREGDIAMTNNMALENCQNLVV